MVHLLARTVFLCLLIIPSILASDFSDNDALQNYSKMLQNLSSWDAGNSMPNVYEEKNGSNWKDWLLRWQSQKINSESEKENSTAGEGKHKFVNVRIGGGSIRGNISHEAGPEKPVFMFKGVPMAEPPVGKLRFRPLQAKRPWSKMLDATKYGPACLSNTTRTRSPQHYISEDCIYMNVFTSPKCMQKPCPVLFYVHGGGFVYDSATMFNDSQIVRKYASDGIVFLIPAYRLGVFGFFDMGNDRTVKRNLGMHDIIFALEWTQKEVHAFGGDPKRITVMGNSAGASAVTFLLTSPALKENHFQQAIISSGVPSFSYDTDLEPSKALLNHFNCSRHSANDSRPLSDWQKVECLRRIDSLDLLRQQQINEEQSNLLFVGPETDTELLPAKSFTALLKYWKVLPIMKMTTKFEMLNGPNVNVWQECADDCAMFNYVSRESFQQCVRRYNGTFAEIPRRLLSVTTKNEYEGPANSKEYTDKSANLKGECIRVLYSLGYFSRAALNECLDRYSATFYTEENMRVSFESMHAEAFLTALTNTRKGGQSFVGEFEIANYSNHANDMYFFIGIHELPLDRLDVRLMDWYYPQIIKNFVNEKAPDKGWKAQNWNGRNYFRITFNVSDNGTLIDWPHGVDGYQDLAGLDFWLHEMPQVEQKATQQTETTDDSQTWQNVYTPPTGSEWDAKWKKQQDQEKHDPKRVYSDERTKTILSHGTFIAKPPLPVMVGMPIDDQPKEDKLTDGIGGEDDGTDMPIGDQPKEDKLTDGIGGEDDGTDMPIDLPNDGTLTDDGIGSYEDDGTNDTALTTNKSSDLAFGSELHRVWSAFWLTMAIVVVLAVALLLLSVNRHRSSGRYAYSSNNSVGDGEFRTEKSRIFVANDANAMRYT